MYKILRIAFSSAAVIRALNILTCIIILKIWEANETPSLLWKDFNFNIEIEFAWYEIAMAYLLAIAYPVLTILWLIFSFKPAWSLRTFLKRKGVAIFLFCVEVLLLLTLGFILYVQLDDIFYEPEPSTYLDEIIGMFGGRERIITPEEKLRAICFGIATFCSLVITLHFWWLYNKMKASHSTDQAI